MRVVVTGATGLIGSALLPQLRAQGHEAITLVRGVQSEPERASWDPVAGTFSPGAFDRADAVVHLAGASIAGGRWTAARKALIRDSRVNGTRVLAEALAALSDPPRVLVAASALGYYGSRGDERLDETSPPGAGFLPDTCQAWESAADPIRARGIRVVHLRSGIVLSPAGGALGRMLPPFRLGVGGILGAGDQYMSWISLDDMVQIILAALTTETLSGPINAVAPEPVTNREFTTILGRVLRRPTVLPLPAFAVRLIFGEMGQALLLDSTRVYPMRLADAGFPFAHPTLEAALRHVIQPPVR